MHHASSARPLDRILDPVGRCLTPEVARALVELRTDPETLARIEQLADHCNLHKGSNLTGIDPETPGVGVVALAPRKRGNEQPEHNGVTTLRFH